MSRAEAAWGIRIAADAFITQLEVVEYRYPHPDPDALLRFIGELRRLQRDYLAGLRPENGRPA